MSILGGVSLLKDTVDCDGKTLIDDGLSSVLAWQGILAQYNQDKDRSPSGEPWDPKVVDVLIHGLTISWATYDDNTDVAHREAWNAIKHDEENNKYRPTSVAKKLAVVRARLSSFGRAVADSSSVVSCKCHSATSWQSAARRFAQVASIGIHHSTPSIGFSSTESIRFWKSTGVII
jgi:hypothetical protein